MNRTVRRLSESPGFLVLSVLAISLIAVAVLAPVLAPHDPLKTDYDHILAGSSWQFPLGTDQLGRCVLSRLIYGGRTSLLIVFVVLAISSAVGIGIGMVAGWIGGRVDLAVSALVDMTMALPSLVFVIAFVGMTGPGLSHTIIAMTAIGWCEYARVSRAMVLSIRNADYIAQATLSGVGPAGLLGRYVLPNVLPHTLVIVTQGFGECLLNLAGLSLLGLASQPPTPEWGFMLAEGRRFIQTAPHMMASPGLVIVLHVIVFSLLGDRLRDLLQPQTMTDRRSGFTARARTDSQRPRSGGVVARLHKKGRT
ncbi:MAG: ABC transporter permease [Aeromicrobium sp.]|uniref:ABC transporter permease n=1 Tax=Aeromicrobium sp. TaxID=1871063 RepID=UPI0039E2FDDE